MILENEIKELDRQRQEVENRLRELEAKERFQSGVSRPSGRLSNNPARGGVAPLKRFREEGDYRGRPIFPNKRRFIEEPPARVPTITSTVIKVSEKDPEKPQPSLVLKNEEDKKRSKNLFGVLMGTLEQFKKEEAQKSDADAKRQEIEQKVESKVQTERNELLERHKKIIQEQKDRELVLKEQIKKKQEEKELELLEQKWSKHNALLSTFHRTITKPHIYFMPNPNAPPFEFKQQPVDQDNHSKEEKGKGASSPSSESSDSEGERKRKGNGKPQENLDADKSKERGSGSEKEDN